MSTQLDSWAGTVSTLAFPFPAAARKSAARPRAIAQRRLRVSESATEVMQRIQAGRTIVAPQGNRGLVYRTMRRVLDVVGASVLVVLLSPVMLFALVVLLFTTGGRPLFCQRRVGEGGRLFPMLKFRTMRLDAVKLQHLVQNEKNGPIFKNRRDPRITRFGRRRTSIDEMPQLFNVLAGHMSLVGPRPPIAEEVAKYQLWQRERLSVRPGLTCLWQVSGRSDVGFEDWVRMDIWYIRNQTLWTDLMLLIKTPLTVITCRGAY